MTDLSENLLSQSSLAESVDQKLYARDFHDHTMKLLSFELDNILSRQSRFVFNSRVYFDLELSAFELAPLQESGEQAEVNWQLIQDIKAELKKHIRLLIGDAHDSPFFRPLVQFTVHSLENYLIYESKFPNSTSNPWAPVYRMFRSGYIFLLTDSKEHFGTYIGRAYRSITPGQKDAAGFIVRGSQRTGGLIIDNSKYKWRLMVLDHLKKHGNGFANSIPLEKLAEFLRNKKVDLPIDQIQVQITTPLKKTGLIGSTIHGFFFISSANDLIQTFCFHNSKNFSINRILEAYRLQMRRYNIDDDIYQKCKYLHFASDDSEVDN